MIGSSSHPATARPGLWEGPVNDVDVHVTVPSVQALYPHLDAAWIQHIEEREWEGPATALLYPPALTAGGGQTASRSPDNAQPASGAATTVEDVLGQHQDGYVILNCVYPIDGGPPDFSAALAKAVNDWLLAEWLEADDRVRASIVVPTRDDPSAIAAEIDRVGGHPGFVQVLLPARSGKLYGKRLYWPVFEAIVRNDLVAGIHWGGSNDGLPPTPQGWPAWYIEEYVAEVGVFEAQLASLIAEGVLQKFASLRVALLESGFTWLPVWMWDLDRNWKALRREVPWVRRPPFELVREHVRVSTAPLCADSSTELKYVIEWLGSSEILMYASDWPHLHGDDLAVLLGALPLEAQAKVMHENAREWYRMS